MKQSHKELFDELKNKLTTENITPNNRVLLIDGLNTFIRVFAAVPVVNDDGLHIGGISGFIRSIGYAIQVTKPTRVILVFDGKGGSTRRKKLFPDYKERRNPTLRLNRTELFQNPEHEQMRMRDELLRIIQYIQKLPITMFAIDYVEADDVIGYIATTVLPKESKVFIMSTDKDFLQLVSDRIEVWSPTKKKIYTKELVKKEFGIPPENMCLFRSVNSKGDKSDNIKGIRGLGEKTILKKLPLLSENRKVEIDELIEYARNNDVQKVVDGHELIKRNYSLMQLSDAYISATAKSLLLERMNAPIKPMNRFDFLRLVMEDKLWAGIPDIELWLQTHISTLDRFAHLSNKKKG